MGKPSLFSLLCFLVCWMGKNSCVSAQAVTTIELSSAYSLEVNAIAKGDTVVAVWIQGQPNRWTIENGPKYFQIAYAHSFNGGKSWSKQDTLPLMDRMLQINPSLAVDNTGTIYLSYMEIPGNGAGSWIRLQAWDYPTHQWKPLPDADFSRDQLLDKPSLAITNGNLQLIYAKYLPNLSHAKLVHQQFNLQQKNWSKPTTLFNQPNVSVLGPAAITLPSQEIFIAFGSTTASFVMGGILQPNQPGKFTPKRIARIPVSLGAAMVEMAHHPQKGIALLLQNNHNWKPMYVVLAANEKNNQWQEPIEIADFANLGSLHWNNNAALEILLTAWTFQQIRMQALSLDGNKIHRQIFLTSPLSFSHPPQGYVGAYQKLLILPNNTRLYFWLNHKKTIPTLQMSSFSE